LWANPQQLKDSPRLDDLAVRLSLDAAALRDKLRFYGDKQFMYLARHQTPDFARQGIARELSGCARRARVPTLLPGRERSPRSLLGLTNVDGHGIAGVELAFEDWLQGIPGKKRFIKDLARRCGARFRGD
jgi:cell division protein FtsI (penicillin-binding protein 3)